MLVQDFASFIAKIHASVEAAGGNREAFEKQLPAYQANCMCFANLRVFSQELEKQFQQFVGSMKANAQKEREKVCGIAPHCAYSLLIHSDGAETQGRTACGSAFTS